MSLTVNREKLLEELKTRRDEIIAYYDAQRTILQDALTALTSTSAAWADYHKAIADGLANGDYVYDGGRIKSAVPQHSSGRAAGTGSHVPLPDKPDSKTAKSFGPRGYIEVNLQQLDAYYLPTDIAPYNSAIAMLELSDDEKITIEGSDYDRMLSKPVGRNFRWNDYA